MTTQEKIEVMKAYLDGKDIQIRCKTDTMWEDWVVVRCEPNWNWEDVEYRIKPESTYRPYKNTEEMIEDFKKRFNEKVPPYAKPMIWLKFKDINDCRFITEYMGKTVVLFDSALGMCKLFDCYTYLDGSPCGMKED